MEDWEAKLSITVQKQLFINNKIRQLIKSCKLGEHWKKNNFHSYKSIRDGAKISFEPMYGSKQKLSFKKNSSIIIRDGLLHFESKDTKTA